MLQMLNCNLGFYGRLVEVKAKIARRSNGCHGKINATEKKKTKKSVFNLAEGISM